MPSFFSPLADHLLQSSAVALLITAACFALRHNPARARYWLWLAASVKFLVPFSLLVSAGSRIEIPLPGRRPLPAMAVEQISTSFAPSAAVLPKPAKTASSRWPEALIATWLLGSVCVAGGWLLRWLRLRALARAATPIPFSGPIPLKASPTSIEPGIFGILRPVLLIPEGLTARLTRQQFEAIVAHELCHLRSRDNFTAAVHMLVEALFWFHPLVWWIGARLMAERERACDEAVLLQGNAPAAYAQGILNVCKFYVESPLPCASGVTGADLKRRIQHIMTRGISRDLTFACKALLVVAAVAAVALPVALGILRAQTLPPPPAFSYEVASIRPATPGATDSRIGPGPQGGMRTVNTATMQLLTFAYDVRDFQFSDAPGWVRAQRFDVSFTPDRAEPALGPGMSREQAEALFNRHRQRMQMVLRDRFGLVLRAETREMPVYALTVARGGHKLAQPAEGSRNMHMRTLRGRIQANGAYLKMFTDSLSGLLSRPVLNETGLDGPFDFDLQWTPDSAAPDADATAPSLFTALTEQLGLRLESKRAPASVFVIERIRKPSEN